MKNRVQAVAEAIQVIDDLLILGKNEEPLGEKCYSEENLLNLIEDIEGMDLLMEKLKPVISKYLKDIALHQ